MSSSSPLPAHQTKHIETLSYDFLTHTFHLSQLADGSYNGTALWLGAQCLSIYLADALRPASKFRTRSENTGISSKGTLIALVHPYSTTFAHGLAVLTAIFASVLAANWIGDCLTEPASSSHRTWERHWTHSVRRRVRYLFVEI